MALIADSESRAVRTERLDHNERVGRHYSFLASHYDRLDCIQRVPREARDYASSLLSLSVDGSVLESGCGTGLNFPHIKELWPDARIVGLDVAGGMLALARQRCAQNGWEDVRLEQVAIESYLLGEQFDAVLFSLAICMLKDPASALKHAWKLIRPGGNLVILDAALPAMRYRRIANKLLAAPIRGLWCSDIGVDPRREAELLGPVADIRFFMVRSYHVFRIRKPVG